MNRREMMLTVGAVAAATALPAFADKPAPAPKAKADPPPAGHEHHHAGPSPLADAATACIEIGTACLQHCLSLLGGGDVSMAPCASAVSDMLAQSRAVLDLSLAGSKFLPPAARLMSDIAKACEAECRKHADKHAACKACADSCATLIQECGKVPV